MAPPRTLPLLLAGVAALALLVPTPAPAQSDPAAQSLIDQLRPRANSGTRGIRMPSAEPAPVATPAPTPAPISAAVPPPAPRQAAPAPRPAAPAQAAVAVPQPVTSNGAPAVSMTINFPTGSAQITPDAARALAPLGRALTSADLSAFRFRIEGHTDTVGDANANQLLSERRAAAVRDYLTERFGVPASRLESAGFGSSRPAIATPDQTPEPRNRRVQIVNLDG